MDVEHVECGIRRQTKGEIFNNVLFWLIFVKMADFLGGRYIIRIRGSINKNFNLKSFFI